MTSKLRGKRAAPIDESFCFKKECKEEPTSILFEPIDSLQSFDIQPDDVQKLQEAGFATVGQLFQAPQKTLLAIKGISEAKYEKIMQAGKKIIPAIHEFATASTLHERAKRRIFITTGSKQIDEALGGGLESMSVTEVHGEFRTGKTQLCHTLCVTTQLERNQGGAAGKVAFVDTEGTFRPQRVAEIAKTRFDLNPDDVLENIVVARAYNHETQMELVTKLGVLFADPTKGPFRLLIIDSITSLFRTDFHGRGELSERQQRLNAHLVTLVKHAEEFNIAVFLVNQVMADPGAISMFGPVMRPVGGHVLSHAVHTRIMLKKGRDNTRICRIIDSPCRPETECSFSLSPGGVCDVED